MRIRILAYVFLGICGLLTSRTGFSQIGRTSGINIPFRTPGSDSVKVIKILNANTFHSEQKSNVDSGDVSYWVGDVRIQQENTLIYCDSMVMFPKANYLECYGHVHINDNDSTHIYSDYMKYLVDVKTVHFQKNVKLTDGKGVLTTEDLDYYLNTHIGVYNNGGKIVTNKTTILTSRQGTYYEATKDVHFRDNVVLQDPQYDLFADSLLYNTSTQRANFITLTKILFKDTTHRTVLTRTGYYDLNTHKAEFGLRPIITDGSQKIIGDSVRFDDSTGISVANGNAIYTDTAQGIVLKGDHMISDRIKKTFLATDHPVMIIKQDKDSLYVTADTLFSGRLIDAYQLQQKIRRQDSIHKAYIDSVQKVEEDSLHNIALSKRTAQDTLIAALDSTGHQKVRDMSDSIRGRGMDSLVRADSLAKAQIVTDSLAAMARITDSLSRVDSLAKVTARNDSIAKAQTTGRKKRAPSTMKSPPGGRPGPGGMAGGSGGQRPPGGSKPPEGEKPPGAGNGPDTAKAPPVKVEPDRDRMSFVDTSAAPVTDTTLRYILGYHHVRIFSDSLQAVSDSLFYSTRDSVFRLFTNPIAWGNGNYQITGDTMYVYTKNKKANRLYVFENALAINKVASNFYNQIKGTTINTYFKGGDVDYMRAKGNAESIYYVKDDNNAYTGVNKAHADIIDMIFQMKEDSSGRELRKVAMRNDVEGSMIPFGKVSFDDMRLRGFKWQESRRPKSKQELLGTPHMVIRDSAGMFGDSARMQIDSSAIPKDSTSVGSDSAAKAALLKASDATKKDAPASTKNDATKPAADKPKNGSKKTS